MECVGAQAQYLTNVCPCGGSVQELTVPITSAHEGLSMESVSGGKAVDKLTKEVNDHLRVHMSFTQPAKARPPKHS